jgi:P27 family predicted phage terminase small subunit
MGRRGPAPKPTALKLIAGNPGHREISGDEPLPPAGAPDAPSFVDERALQVWNALVPRIARVGLARSIDGGPLERYCVMFVQWRDCQEFIRKNGAEYAVRGEPRLVNGVEKPGRVLYFREYPAVARAAKLSRDMLQIEREYGLTPAARTRIRLDAEKVSGGDANELKRRFFAQGASSTPPPPLATTAVG